MNDGILSAIAAAFGSTVRAEVTTSLRVGPMAPEPMLRDFFGFAGLAMLSSCLLRRPVRALFFAVQGSLGGKDRQRRAD